MLLAVIGSSCTRSHIVTSKQRKSIKKNIKSSSFKSSENIPKKKSAKNEATDQQNRLCGTLCNGTSTLQLT